MSPGRKANDARSARAYAGQYMHHVLAEPTYLAPSIRTRPTSLATARAISGRGRRSCRTSWTKRWGRATIRRLEAVRRRRSDVSRTTGRAPAIPATQRLIKPSADSAGTGPTTRASQPARLRIAGPDIARGEDRGPTSGSTDSAIRPTTISSASTRRPTSIIPRPNGD